MRAFARNDADDPPEGRIVLFDAFASDDPAKAAAFNAMKRFRDPSTVEFRPLTLLRGLFAIAGLPEPEARFYQVSVERERVVAMAFPAGGDRPGLRAMLDASVEGTRWAWAPGGTGTRCGSRIRRRCSRR